MGRADAKDRHQRRAREDLEKGLKRNDSALACAGLLGLPPEQRTASMGAVARLLRREALDLFTRRQWAALRLLSTRFDQEPLLVSTDDADDASSHAAVIALRLVARALAPPVIAGAAAPEIVDRPLAQALLTLALTVSQRPRQRTIALRLIEGLRFHKDLAAVAKRT